MEKEISSGVMLGIVLIALAAVIGIGFGVFAIARGTANDGTTTLIDNLGSINESQFSDYDQKVVTGVQVVSALDNFDGKTVVVLIATQGVMREESIASTDKGALAVGSIASPGVSVAGNDTPVTEITFVNYNALFEGAEVGSGGGTAVDFGELVDGFWVSDVGLSVGDNNVVQFNKITGNISKAGKVEKVNSGARFQANLIKDSGGTTIGIAFYQIGA